MQFKKVLAKKNLIVICILLFLLLLFSYWILKPLIGKSILQGVRVGEVDLSGLTSSQGELLLKQSIRLKNIGNKVILKSENDVWELTFQEIGIQYLVEAAIDQAYEYGHSGSWFRRMGDRISSKWRNVHIPLTIRYNESKLRKVLFYIKGQVDHNPQNASIQLLRGKLLFQSEEQGQRLDVDKNIKLIENEIAKENFLKIQLTVDPMLSKIKKDDVKEISQELSGFSTTFNPQDKNRTNNLVLGCRRVNGTILYPGEEFSMNRALGPRTSENGYKEARIIFRNEFVNGIGGGICQLSSTLYNAVLKSRFQVTDRTHHSIPSQYVRMGQDATISEGSIDFKFVNNREYPIAFFAEIQSNRLVIRIFGQKEDKVIVKLLPEQIKVYTPVGETLILDNSLADGEKKLVAEGRKGYRVVLYREIYDLDGTLLMREKLTEDFYKPIKPQIKMNRNTINIYKKNS